MFKPSERLQKKMRIWCRKVGAHYGQLDILVEDIKCQQANRVNNAGIKSQVRYLLQHLPPKEFRKAVRHELRTLMKGGMVQQSKTKPKLNISRGRKKKRRRE